ncbi:tyrosine-type recombinase/integrase [Bradyrhizobium jicamae]|uniref:Tyrosine-type recombinase/integrase n=1 Tax=Bradyrhizobium jicamae TaxID=280332 RepID=A0ABS5FJB6_9BRAD|nr:site-specific integrase [Bradyrhizobium jicamae]MBR0796856.1 tyrosine-type recombinase/integrase [Bradyrhizobium jicamae]
MLVERLTKRFVETAEPSAKVDFYYDGELPGFSLKVHPSGEKRWCVEYRPGAGGRSVIKRRMVIGSITKVTAEQARNTARKILAAVALGDDPAAARKGAREMPTFRAFVTRYLDEEASAKLKVRTIANYRIYLSKHTCPSIGSLKLDEIRTAHIARLHRRIGQTRPMTANRVVECVSSVYRYAATCGLVSRSFNPAAFVEAFREQRRERFLSTEELARLGDSIREAETTGIPWNVDTTKHNAKHIPKTRKTVIDRDAAAALRLLILIGARLREILHLRWEHVDFERGILLLPDSKTGRKTVVLNAPALSILADLARRDDFVIPGYTKGKPRADLNRPWRAVCRHARLEGVRIHDLRHTHASIGVGFGLGLPIIGKLLGHTQPATTARYAHLDNDPLRRASDKIGNRIAAAMGDALHSNSKSNVLELPHKQSSSS